MTPDQHLEIVRVEGMRLATMPDTSLDEPVPALPDWTVERVVRHVGKIHQWVTALLQAPGDADINAAAATTRGMPHGTECLPAYRESLEEMLDAFAASDPDRTVATFLGPATVRFWARRQAHEVTVHRIDAADAVHAGGGSAPVPIDPEGALDGVDEWLHVFVATRYLQRVDAVEAALRNRTVGIDLGGGTGWKVHFAADGSGCEVTSAATRTQLDSSDVLLIGTPEATLLTCWRRRPLGNLEVHGDVLLAEVFHDTLRF